MHNDEILSLCGHRAYLHRPRWYHLLLDALYFYVTSSAVGLYTPALPQTCE